MGAHSTWFEFLPGYGNLKLFAQGFLGRGWTWQMFQATHFAIDHVLATLLVLAFLVFGATRFGITAQTTVDRTEFDINWNMALPSGGNVLANDVTLTVELSLVAQA